MAEHFWKSGYFSDVKSMSQAVVKVVFGEELGLGVGASMRGIYIIEGKPSFSANILATLIKRSEHYDYEVKVSTEEKCSIEFFEDDESLGVVDFTIAQARKIKTKEHGKWVSLADTLRWQNSPQDMLFARCLTRGERQHCPDVTGGHPAYTPEELGAETDAQGAPLFVESRRPSRSPPRRLKFPASTTTGSTASYRATRSPDPSSPASGCPSRRPGNPHHPARRPEHAARLAGLRGRRLRGQPPRADGGVASGQADAVLIAFAAAVDDAGGEEVDGVIVEPIATGEEATDAVA